MSIERLPRQGSENDEAVTYNPDRVETEDTQETTREVIPESRTRETVHWLEESGSSWAGRFVRPEDGRVRTVAGTLAIATLAGTLSTNIPREFEQGRSNDALTKENNVRRAFDTVDIQTLVQETEKEVCRIVDGEFMHRFVTRDENGIEAFNPGAVVVPFAVGITEACKAKIDVELHIPYHFARAYNEIMAKNPSAREALVNKLASFITEEAQNQLVIKGVAGVTETALVWNREKNILATGKPLVDLGKFDIQGMTFEGTASTEGEKSTMNAKAESLQGVNPENVQLAGKRLQDMRPLIAEALEKSGVDPKVLKSAKSFRYEHNLVAEEISEIAKISDNILGSSLGTDAESAYALIVEINKNNRYVLDELNKNPKYMEVLDKHIFSKRGVNISFSAETEYGKTSVYNVLIPLPLLLLLLPGIRVERTPGELKLKSAEYERVTPEQVIEQTKTVTRPISRRIFSETTPATLDQERSFDSTYDQINISENPRDTHALLQHMLIEEVLPSLDGTTKEPLIDYENIVNVCREYLASNTRKDGVEKGHYATPKDTERKMTEMLLEMWERHDIATYPMEGIDIKTVLNYRNSDEVVYWAKTLAYTLTKLATETYTTDEFRTKLMEKIQEAIETRMKQGNTDRNIFVQSDYPRTTQ